MADPTPAAPAAPAPATNHFATLIEAAGINAAAPALETYFTNLQANADPVYAATQSTALLVNLIAAAPAVSQTTLKDIAGLGLAQLAKIKGGLAKKLNAAGG